MFQNKIISYRVTPDFKPDTDLAGPSRRYTAKKIFRKFLNCLLKDLFY